MGQAIRVRHGRSGPLLDVVGPSSWNGFRKEIWQKPGEEKRYTPFDDHLADEIFPIWGRAFLPPHAPLADMTLLNEALTAIRHLEEKSSLEQLQSPGRTRISVPIGRAGWSCDYRKIFPQIVDSNFLAQLAFAGFGHKNQEFIKAALRNYDQELSLLPWD